MKQSVHSENEKDTHVDYQSRYIIAVIKFWIIEFDTFVTYFEFSLINLLRLEKEVVDGVQVNVSCSRSSRQKACPLPRHWIRILTIDSFWMVMELNGTLSKFLCVFESNLPPIILCVKKEVSANNGDTNRDNG